MSYLTEQAELRPKNATPQNQKIPGSTQTPNEAGGYAWEVDDWTKLDRFLILGTEGGTYYVGAKALTKMHSEVLEKLIAEDGIRVLTRVRDVSLQNLAAKTDPAIYALAMASAKGDETVRREALGLLPLVCRTGTHLFQFLTFRQAFGGWGRGLRRAVSNWYLNRDPDKLALQLVKYRQREGWTHRDVLRKAHPDASKTLNGPEALQKQTLLRWAVKGVGENLTDVERYAIRYPHRLVQGFEMAQRSPNPKVTAGLVREYGLPREALPTEHLTDPAVWIAMLEQGMPLHALIRNLATMTRIGALRPMSEAARQVCAQITDRQALERARVHPMSLLIAARTYAQGHGERGTNTWTPLQEIVKALDQAFYLAFPFVPTSGKRILMGIDVSGSMAGSTVLGVPNMDCRQAAAAAALVTAATEPRHLTVAFDYLTYPIPVTGKERVDSLARTFASVGGGGTNCALPIQYAIEHRLLVDAFVIYTDSQTWQGSIHPVQAIRKYRKVSGIPAKLVVVAMEASTRSVADPKDAGMMNVVGLDASAPTLISQFIAD